MQTLQTRPVVQAPCKKELLLQSLNTQQRFANMTRDHKRLWTSFIHNNPDLFTHVAYDVHVGAGCKLDPNWPEYIKKMATKLTQKKIDVVALRNERLWCIEIKEFLDVTSPGQALAYCHLLDLHFLTDRSPQAAVLYQYESWDMATVCVSMDVALFEPNIKYLNT